MTCKYYKCISKVHQVASPNKKSHGLVGWFPNIHKENKEVYDSIDAFIHQLKEDIGETVATIYFKDITGITTIDDDDKKLFLPHHASKHQYYAQWCFERGSIIMKKIRYENLYHIILI